MVHVPLCVLWLSFILDPDEMHGKYSRLLVVQLGDLSCYFYNHQPAVSDRSAHPDLTEIAKFLTSD